MRDKSTLAYHEAGHAAMHWFFGTLGDLQLISMVPDEINMAYVRSKPFNMAPTFIAPLPEPYQKPAVIKAIMHNLAGPSAENRVTEQDPEWFSCAFDECEWDDDSHDIPRAIELSRVLHGQGRRAWGFCRIVAKWTDEALDMPVMRAVVDAVANRLMTVDVLDGGDAIDLMEAAAGGHPKRLPCVSTPKWRRRLIWKGR